MPLGTAHLWRPRRRPRERSALPGKRADPPPPPTAAGCEVVFRLQSTSTLILLASLSSPQEFVQRATADTAFWSFYFRSGRRRQRRGAVAGAGPAPASAMGDLSFLAQLSAGGRSAWLPGVVLRPRRAALPGFYDPVASRCSAMPPPSGCTARFLI